jgi:chemotaxis protein methyltransferase CheR
MMLTNQQFDRTRRLASRLAGIQLVERHRELLHRRSRRLGIRDDAALDSLLDAAEEGEKSATEHLLYLLTTKFTGFFRHPRHFDFAAEHAVRAARQRGRAHLWSVGTATGEEVWSLAMALIETFACDDPPVSILASDVDAEALAVAQRGEYSEVALKSLSLERRARFFNAPARCQVAPTLCRLVKFQTLNLAGADWLVAGPFDLIFCRNVLMYLETRHRQVALERMASLLAPDGLLMIDPTEHLGNAGRLFVSRGDGVYSRRRDQTPPRTDSGIEHSTAMRAEQ